MALTRVAGAKTLSFTVSADGHLRLSESCGSEESDRGTIYFAGGDASKLRLDAVKPATCGPLERWFKRRR